MANQSGGVQKNNDKNTQNTDVLGHKLFADSQETNRKRRNKPSTTPFSVTTTTISSEILKTTTPKSDDLPSIKNSITENNHPITASKGNNNLINTPNQIINQSSSSTKTTQNKNNISVKNSEIPSNLAEKSDNLINTPNQIINQSSSSTKTTQNKNNISVKNSEIPSNLAEKSDDENTKKKIEPTFQSASFFPGGSKNHSVRILLVNTHVANLLMLSIICVLF
jgi:hypothetical protein